ncbi:MAG: VWA domain-containing protein, partial [Promethearchaeota archaeon]
MSDLVDVLDIEDTVLCIDVSRSMARKDIASKSRLEIVKDALIDFILAKLKIDKRDRFSIVAFSTNAEIKLKLTNNKGEIIEAIKSLKPKGISGLGEGIAASLNILSHEILQEGQNVNRILVISDGKAWLGTIDPIKKAEMASQLGIIVDT